MDNTKIANDWITENRVFIENWRTTALKRFWDDTSVHIPRAESERANGLQVWLEQFRLRMRSEFEVGFRHQFPSMSDRLPEDYIAEVFDHNVWPKIKPDVQRYAMHGFAAAWRTGHFGDATTLGVPEQIGSYWYVPISIRGYEGEFGKIVLTQEGDVLQDKTTSRKQLLEAARGTAFRAVAATAR